MRPSSLSPPKKLTNQPQWIYIGSALYIPSVFTTKAAILVLLARIFAVHHLAARAIHVLILLLFLTLLPIEGLKLGVCRPVSAYWTLATSSAQLAARCVDQGTLFKADITVAILTDFMILLIPIPFVFSLSFSLGKKIRILLSLATGGGAVGVALYKGILVFSPSPEQDPTKDFAILSVLSYVLLLVYLFTHSTHAFPHTFFFFFCFPAFRGLGGRKERLLLITLHVPVDPDISIYRFLEMNIGLMCACLPSVTILLDKIRNSSQRRHGYSKSSSFHRRRRKGGGMVLGLSSFDVRRKRKQDVLAGGESSDPSSTTGGTITTFNMELAVLAGQTDVELCANNGKGFPAEESGVGVQVDAQGRCVRIDSMQGRSEGWLAPAPV